MAGAALGFAPHSGWAAVVGVVREGGGVRVVLRDRVILAVDPESKQPYHALEHAGLPDAGLRLRGFVADARDRAQGELDRIVAALGVDHAPTIMGILDSSGRQGGTLEAILASHALIHTADGEHFRAALAAAAERRGLRVVRVPAKTLENEATRRLARSRDAIARAIRDLGRDVGPPWGADQKSAALLAWLLLGRADG